LSDTAGAVSVDLKAGRARGEGRDQLSGLEAVDGTPLDDAIAGDADENFLVGAGGADVLDGRSGSNDLYGGDGDDDYSMESRLL
jgi:Ca2+-binding RTX toxin-like protein